MKHRPFSLTTAAVLGAALLASAPLVASDAPYYVLDGFGGVHAGGGAPVMSPATPYFGTMQAADLEIAVVGYYVLDVLGTVHAGGGASPFSPATPYFGVNVARDLELR